MRIPADTVVSMGRDVFTKTTYELQSKLKDYHVLTMSDNRVETAQFECFNVESIDTKTIQELKKQISKTLEIQFNDK